MGAERRAERRRATRETEVAVRLCLDGSGVARVATGIGILDHMLESLALHSRFDLEVTARGDLSVDPHHTVEDVALVLGLAIADALGDRAGIERFGHAEVPMDDSLASAAVDCGGRAFCAARITFPGPAVGGLPTSLLGHFFESLCRSSGITLHLSGHGRDDHHLAEAAFKALARALRQAVRRDPDLAVSAPSVKGSV